MTPDFTESQVEAMKHAFMEACPAFRTEGKCEVCERVVNEQLPAALTALKATPEYKALVADAERLHFWFWVGAGGER